MIPQFLVTALSSIIFAIFEPDKSVPHGDHPGKMTPVNGTSTNVINQNTTVMLTSRQDDSAAVKYGVNSVAIIFR